MSIAAAEKALLALDASEVMFPGKIVQIFNDETQERINCLPATFKPEKICGPQVGFDLPAQERTYCNAVGLAYMDVAMAMQDRALEAGMGQVLLIQHDTIFEHARLTDWVRI